MLRPLTISALALAAFAAVVPTTSAEACGGFFCNRDPIDQSKEKIIFGIDEAEGKVDVHVQIFYQGSAERFAWIVPVPDVPTVGLSSDALFNQLGWQTGPRFDLQWEERGSCTYDGWYGYPGGDVDFDAAPTAEDGAGGDRGVDVLSAGQTGPYDWVVVGADSTDALLAWLADPDGNPSTPDSFDVPAEIGSKLGGYLAGGAKFVAFKLNKEADVGDIAPIRLSYDGSAASIPLVLTSIAATPNMRLEPYVFANKRAVPSNYLHVQINEAAISWLSYGSNYDDVITQAADEAGGQAFATDFFGLTEPLQDVLYEDGRFDLAALRTHTDPVAFFNAFQQQGFQGTAAILSWLQDVMPMPAAAVNAGIDAQSFYNCLDCYPQYTSLIDFDPDTAVDRLDERIVTPMREGEALFHDFKYVTRMTSSVSPEEMDVDPMFVLNADMTTPVSNVHSATYVVDCGDGGNISESPRWLELQDGRIVQVPPETWFRETGATYDSWLADIDQPAAEVIEQTGATGQPETIQDQGGLVDAAIDAQNAWILDLTGRGDSPTGDPTTQTPAGCGCATSSAPTGVLPLVFGLLGLAGVRRRRD